MANGSYLAGAAVQGALAAISPEQRAARADARLRKQKSDEQLQLNQETSDLTSDINRTEKEALLIETQNLKAQQKQQRQQMANSVAYNAIDRFNLDRDVRHLDQWAKDVKNYDLPNMPFKDVVRIENVTEADIPGINKQLGGDNSALLSNPKLKGTLARIVKSSGEVVYGSTDVLINTTDYRKYASERALQEELTRSIITKNLRTGKGTSAGTADEREAARVVLEEYGLEEGDEGYLDKFNEAHKNIVNRDRQTAGSKEQDEVELAKKSIDTKANDKFEQDFFDLDMSDFSVRRQFENEIERIERLGKVKLDGATKKKLGQVKQLIAISGDVTSDLTDEETGIIDSFSRSVKKHISNDIEGINATAAYSAYRNVLRNALYGSVLTEGEMKAFKDQFGDITQQTGPALAQFKVAISQLAADLQSLRDTENSYVMHYRAGASGEQLDNIIDRLEERLEFFTDLESGVDTDPSGFITADTTTQEPTAVEIPPDIEAGLEGLLGPGDAQ